MSVRKHVLICAVACHPSLGSEPAVGWQWVLRAAEKYRVTVVTADSRGSRTAIEDYRAANPDFAAWARFVYLAPFDTPPSIFVRKVRHHIPLFYYRAYRDWQKTAAAIAADIARQESVDCVHQLTYITFREPGFLDDLAVPFAWGPIGGTQDVPWRFLLSLGVVDGIRNAVRNIVNLIQFRRTNRVAECFRRANALAAVASDTRYLIKQQYGRDSTVIPATACSLPALLTQQRSEETGVTRFVFTGAFVARKGLPYALRALSCLRDVKWTLDVIGRGRLEGRWKAIARRLGIADRVTFHGSVTRERAIEIMSHADAMVLPTLQEGWPTVIMESLSLGVPVITTNHHGMADQVTPECGILLDLESPTQLVRDIAAALRTVAENPVLRKKLAAGALERARHFSAGNQAAAIHRFYESAIDANVGSA
jgi:glycosyltransferase involved in cell wall biosynthesis